MAVDAAADVVALHKVLKAFVDGNEVHHDRMVCLVPCKM